ncbi:MAG: ketopantoate reductase family protein [Christensenellales bacterium]|jgi:2-dehydropantoate 2-reductase
MEQAIRTVAVIGAGAIGGITAAYLTRAGFDVELVCKHADRAAEISGRGVHITGVRGDIVMPVKAVAEIEQLSGKKNALLIVTKAYDMPDAARRALPFLKPDSFVVSMQNGICAEALAEVVGAERAVGCVVGWGAEMLPDGCIHMKSEGEFVIGGYLPDKDVKPLKAVLDHMVPTRISDNIVADLYSKMIINSCITSTGVLSGLYLGQILRMRKARRIFIAIIREALAVAEAMNIRVPPYGGRLDYYSLMRGTGAFADFKRHVLIRLIGFKYRRFKSSTLQALKRGKPTEVDYFNGFIARKGAELGVDTPVNSRITQMVKEIESKARRSDPNNFDDPVLSAHL